MLGVSRNQAHALASRARGQLEKALGVLLVARTGRRACPALDLMLSDWDGRLTVLMRKRVSRHIDQCDGCAERRRGALRSAALYGMAPLAALPRGLRQEVLGLCADDDPLAQAYRQEVTQRAGSFRPNGFPPAGRPPRRRMLVLSGVAAAAGILIAMVSTGIVTVLALSGSHAPRSLDAAQSGGGTGTASAAVTANAGATASSGATTSAGATAGSSPSVPPPAAQPATSGPPSPVVPSASPTKTKPSPSHSATSSAPALPSPSPSVTPRPTRTPTPSATSPTPAPTSTPSPRTDLSVTPRLARPGRKTITPRP
jgi:hypothetical protein